jgi:protein SCO1/2
MKPMSRSWHRWFLGGTLLAGAVAPTPADQAPPEQPGDVSAGWPLSDFRLLDQRGAPFTQEGLRGRWTLLLLGDKRCGAPCASALAALSGLCRRIAGTRALETTQVVFVSLDPSDTPAELAGYLAPYDPRFVGATGPSETLAGIAEDLGLPRAPTSGEDNSAGRLPYDGSIWLIAPDGVIRLQFLPPFDVPTLTAAYLKTRSRG